MSRRKNLEVDEEEYRRVRQLILIKAKRYDLNPVEISDRLTVNFSPEQLQRLVDEVAKAGHALVFKEQVAYSTHIANERQRTPRFGSEPRDQGVRHPKAVDWANVPSKRGSQS